MNMNVIHTLESGFQEPIVLEMTFCGISSPPPKNENKKEDTSSLPRSVIRFSPCLEISLDILSNESQWILIVVACLPKI